MMSHTLEFNTVVWQWNPLTVVALVRVVVLVFPVPKWRLVWWRDPQTRQDESNWHFWFWYFGLKQLLEHSFLLATTFFLFSIDVTCWHWDTACSSPQKTHSNRLKDFEVPLNKFVLCRPLGYWFALVDCCCLCWGITVACPASKTRFSPRNATRNLSRVHSSWSWWRATFLRTSLGSLSSRMQTNKSSWVPGAFPNASNPRT